MSDLNNTTNEEVTSKESKESSDNMPALPETPQQKRHPVMVTMIAILLFLSAVGITAYAFVPSFANNVRKTFFGAKNYYLAIEKENLERTAASFSKKYAKAISAIAGTSEQTTASSLDLKFSYNDAYTLKLGLEEIFPIEVKTTVLSDYKVQKHHISSAYSLGNDNIITTNLLFDNSEEHYGDYYIQIPEMNRTYVGFNIYKILEKRHKDMEEMQKGTEKMKTFLSAYFAKPTSELLLKHILSRYGTIVIKNLKNVTFEKEAEIQANNKSAKNGKFTIKITGKQFSKIMAEWIKTASKDEELKKELIRLGLYTDTEYKEALESLKPFSRYGGEGNISVQMLLWIDDKGNITGRDFIFDETEGGKNIRNTLSYHTVVEGNTKHTELKTMVDDFTTVGFIGSQTTENDVSNGTYIIKFGDEDTKRNAQIVFSYDNLQKPNEKSGYISGNFALKGPETSNWIFYLNAKGTEEKENLLLNFLIGGTNIYSLETTFQKENYEDVPIPSSSEVCQADSEEDLQRYVSTINMNYVHEVGNKYTHMSESISEAFPGVDINQLFSYLDKLEQESEAKDLVLNKNPKSREELPDDAEVEEDGSYKYKITDAQVMANREPSNTIKTYSALYNESRKEIGDILLKATGEKWSEIGTDSANYVYGVLEDEDTFTTAFCTCSGWKPDSDDGSILYVYYDTYNKHIFRFALWVNDKKDVNTIVPKLYSLTSEEISKKDSEKLQALIEGLGKKDELSITFQDSEVEYYFTKDKQYYFDFMLED